MRGSCSAIALTLALAACSSAARSTITGPPSPALMAEFWVQPEANRDLYWGPWGRKNAPSADVVYIREGTKQGGFSPKWEVRDPEGRKWGAKFGDEAQAEVTTSRILWGVGYHQPPNYYLAHWHATDGQRVQDVGPARFRPSIAGFHQRGDWAWLENPFVNTPQYHGLLVLLMMLNSTDLKDDNNGLYTLREPFEGATRWYLVRDVGSSLGETGWVPRRSDVDVFEQAPFITGVQDGYVRFKDRGRHSAPLAHIHPRDVRWICERLERLTERQWHDAFRAGGYDAATTERYLGKIREKIAQGLALGDGGTR